MALATEHWRQYVTSDTLQAVDLKGSRVVVVIERVDSAKMTDRSDSKKEKGVLNVYFKGKQKPLVCKPELCGVLSKLAGSPQCKRWIGMAVELYPTTVFAFGENHEVVRISPKPPTAAQAKTAGARAPDPVPPPTDMVEDEIRTVKGEAPTEDEMREIAERDREEAARG
jgi:hypothetical protein